MLDSHSRRRGPLSTTTATRANIFQCRSGDSHLAKKPSQKASTSTNKHNNNSDDDDDDSNNNNNNSSMPSVWVQLFKEDKSKVGGAVIVRPTVENPLEVVGDLVNAVVNGNKDLGLVARNLNVYKPGTGYPDNEDALDSRTELATLGLTKEDTLRVVAPTHPQPYQEQSNFTTSILGVGVLEKLRLAVFYFVDGEGNPIGTGYFVAPRVAISAAHNFENSETIGTKITGYFGEPHHGKSCKLVVDLIDWKTDFIIFTLEGEEHSPAYLEQAPMPLNPGDQCILVAYQLGIHDELKELGKEPSVGVFPAAVVKARERHFVYSAPSFAGDSGGAIILRGGQACGMHLMTVNEATELQRVNSLDENEATTGDIVQHVNSVQKSVASLIASLASGGLALSISSIMEAYSSNQESKRNASS